MPGTADYRPNIWGPTDGAPVTTYHIDYDRRDIDISSDIQRLLPSATPFLVIMMEAGKSPTQTVQFMWYDHEPATWWGQADGGEADDATSITVDDSSFVKKHDLIKNTRTGEIMRVNAEVTNSTEIPVEREFGKEELNSTHVGGTEKEVINDDDHLMRIGNAMEENSRSPDTRIIQPVKEYNYVQTFRTPFDASNDVTDERLKTSQDERTRVRQDKAIEHRLDIERACLFGERNEHIADKIRTTGGVIQFIKSNVTDIGSTNNGTLTEVEWESFLEQGFDWGSDRKLFITSPRIGSIINQFAANRIQTTSGEETYGMRLKYYTSFHGDVLIATSKSFEKDYKNMGLLLDIKNIEYKPFAGEDSTLKANIQENDRDGWKDEYMTKVGMKVRLEKTHAILEGVER